MKVYIARDWYATMVFTTKPKLIDNGGRMEWAGHRSCELENLIPRSFELKKNECVEAELTLTIKKD